MTGMPSAPRPGAFRRAGALAGTTAIAGRGGLTDEVHRGPALLVERENLQLRGEVDLAQEDPVRDLQVRRGEVEDGVDPSGHQPVADLLRRDRRGGDDPDCDLLLLDDPVQIVDVLDGEVTDLLADLALVAVQQGDNAEAALG